APIRLRGAGYFLADELPTVIGAPRQRRSKPAQRQRRFGKHESGTRFVAEVCRENNAAKAQPWQGRHSAFPRRASALVAPSRSAFQPPLPRKSLITRRRDSYGLVGRFRRGNRR